MTTETRSWLFIDTGEHPGAWNMRFDEHMAERVRRGVSGPVLRLFRWNPPAISLGLHQDIEEVDAVRCAGDGIDMVRRPTGGRAILHDEELTYAVVMQARGSIMEVYKRISLALVRGLRNFGADVGIGRLQPEHLGAAGSPSSIPCFTSTAKYEIEWRGRKLVGSAQRQYREEGVVLQHGSILTGPAHRRLVRYLRADEPTQDRLTREMELKTVDLGEIMGRGADLHDLATCIRRGFEEEWDIVLHATDAAKRKEWTHVPTEHSRG